MLTYYNIYILSDKNLSQGHQPLLFKNTICNKLNVSSYKHLAIYLCSFPRRAIIYRKREH